MKKFISLILCVILSMFYVLTLSSCAEEASNPVTSITLEKDDEDAMFKELDFGNQTVTFITGEVANGAFSERSITVDEASSDSVDTKIYKRNQIVENDLGVKIVLADVLDMNAFTAIVKPVVQSGAEDYDIIAGTQSMDMVFSKENLLVNINDLDKYNADYIDITQPWWSQFYIEQIAYKSICHYLTGDINLRYLGGMYCVFVNGDIYEKYLYSNYGSIYDIVKEGKWTFDLMAQMSEEAYLDNGNTQDKVDEEDRLGFYIYTTEIPGLAVGYGVEWTKKDAEGNISLTFSDEKTFNFLTFMQEFFNTKGVYYSSNIPHINGVSNALGLFASGNSLFAFNKIYFAETGLREMDNYYIIPVPKAKEGLDTEYRTTLHEGLNLYGISAYSANIPAAAATLEYMAKKSYDLVTPEYYDVALKYKYSRDDDSAEMIDLIRKGAYVDFGLIWGSAISDIDDFLRNNFNEKSINVIKSSTRSWSKLLNKLLSTLEENYFE